jgi:hypothetical protein
VRAVARVVSAWQPAQDRALSRTTSAEDAAYGRLGTFGDPGQGASGSQAGDAVAGDHGGGHGQDEADDAAQEAAQRGHDQHDQRVDVQGAAHDLGQLEENVTEAIQGWANEDPSTVMTRLASLRTQVELSGVRWPDRTRMACKALADRVASSLAWADLALERGLFPETSPFLERAIAQGIELGEDRLVRYLSTPTARWTTISAI